MRGPLLCILHTHMEDFTPGGGRKQKKIKAPTTPGNRTLDDEGICIFPPARNIKKMEGCAHKDDIPAPACVLHYGPRPPPLCFDSPRLATWNALIREPP